jgi:polyisoprenoid-binding protein YceI
MASTTLTIDPQHSKASFEVKKLGFLTIKGTLADFTGEVSFDKDAVEQANFTVCVGPVTISTGNAKRDEHLKSEDFFHVNKYPQICFQSTSVQPGPAGYQAIGNLSMLGISQEVSLPFSYDNGVFRSEFSLNRLDYTLGKKFPTFFVGKTIQISINCKIKK